MRKTTRGAKQTEKMKSTDDVIDHHLKAIEQGDVDAVLFDYAADAVLFRSDGIFKGVAAIRPVFEKFIAEFQKPGTTSNTKQRLVAGDYGYMLWTAETGDNVYELAADTFFVKEGKIVVQSFTAKVNSKRERGGKSKDNKHSEKGSGRCTS
jgi:ketosteroid isomerase-like protein